MADVKLDKEAQLTDAEELLYSQGVLSVKDVATHLQRNVYQSARFTVAFGLPRYCISIGFNCRSMVKSVIVSVLVCYACISDFDFCIICRFLQVYVQQNRAEESVKS